MTLDEMHLENERVFRIMESQLKEMISGEDDNENTGLAVCERGSNRTTGTRVAERRKENRILAFDVSQDT